MNYGDYTAPASHTAAGNLPENTHFNHSLFLFLHKRNRPPLAWQCIQSMPPSMPSAPSALSLPYAPSRPGQVRTQCLATSHTFPHPCAFACAVSLHWNPLLHCLHTKTWSSFKGGFLQETFPNHPFF